MNFKILKTKKGENIMKLNMKKNCSNQNGITLIALVVTIVVLLILAGVSVNALFGNSGIIEKAKETQNKMNEAKNNDLEAINELTNLIDNQVNGIEESTGNLITFTIGDIQFQAEKDMTWGSFFGSKYNTANEGKVYLVMDSADDKVIIAFAAEYESDPMKMYYVCYNGVKVDFNLTSTIIANGVYTIGEKYL